MKPEDQEKRATEDPWSQATWEGAELATLMQGARMTMAEKLAWLERMTEPGTPEPPEPGERS
jgi:hypothetical protein